MFDLRRLAKDACEKNIVNDRVKMAPPAPGVGQHHEHIRLVMLQEEFSKQGTSNLIQQKKNSLNAVNLLVKVN